jgi:hypothetical protein
MVVRVTELALDVLDVIVTREVRWFFSGPMPAFVHSWFTSSATGLEREQRVDSYDEGFARDGVGVKHRNSGPIEAKFLVARITTDELAPGVSGEVGDWLKVVTPRVDEVGVRARCRFAVVKDITTRRYSAPSRTDTGCAVELATVEAGNEIAWTLCFETFGDPEVRGDVFERGLAAFLADSPLPAGLSLTADSSLDYPAWVSQLT